MANDDFKVLIRKKIVDFTSTFNLEVSSTSHQDPENEPADS